MAIAASILIASRNNERTLGWCVRSSLQVEPPPGDFEVIVYDDASGAEQAKLLDELEREQAEAIQAGRLRILRNQTHRGVSAGRNLAAQVARGDLLFCLDGDAAPERTWIRSTLPRFSNADIGIVGSRVLFAKRPDMLNGCGGTLNLSANGMDHYVFQPDENSAEESQDVLHVMGCGMVVSRRCWDAIGGFDVTFSSHHEDADLCLRAWKKGFRVITNPQGRVFHDTISHYDPMLYRRWVQLTRGRWLTMLKHFDAKQLLRAAQHQVRTLYLHKSPLLWMGLVQTCRTLLPALPAVLRYRAASGAKERARILPLLYEGLEFPPDSFLHPGILNRAQRLVPARQNRFMDAGAFSAVGRVYGRERWPTLCLTNNARLELGLFRETTRLTLEVEVLTDEVIVENLTNGACLCVPRSQSQIPLELPAGATRATLKFSSTQERGADAISPAAIIAIRQAVQS